MVGLWGMITNPDKHLFPTLTKRDVADYYSAVAPRLLAHAAGRPLTIVRHPNGVDQKGFFQKRAPTGSPLETFTLETNKGSMRQPVVRSADDLLYLVNLAAIVFHAPTATVDRIDPGGSSGRPDRLVFDLDPAEGGRLVAGVARHVRALLTELDLDGFPLATGSKGVHIVVPTDTTYDQARQFMHEAATLLAHRHAEATDEFLIRDRDGRVYVDWLRNTSPHATTVVPYSLRARPEAPVASPITWDDLDRPSDGWSIGEVLDTKDDPWAGFDESRRELTPSAERLTGLLADAGIEPKPHDRFGRS